MALTLFSCGSSSDDEDNGYTDTWQSKIAGTWTITCVRHTQGSGSSETVFQKWRVGTTLNFKTNGTYTDSSNSGNHKWQTNPASDKPLLLDGYEFEIEMSDGNAEVIYYYGEDIWIFCWVKDYPKDEPSDPAQPTTPERKYGYRVKKITRHHIDGYSLYEFSYDSQGRINTYNQNGSKTEFDYSGSYLTLKMWNNDIVTCELNGQLVTGYNWIINGLNHFCRIAHNSQKKPTELNTPLEGNFKLTSQISGFTIDVTTRNEKWNYTYSKEKNDMNIDLNPFLMNIFNGFHSNEALLALLPTDYIGRFDYLVTEQGPYGYRYSNNLKVTRDRNNLITQISVDQSYNSPNGILQTTTEKYDIEYEQYEIK